MKVSVDQRRLKARQMLVEASWAKSALIKALKDNDLEKARKALNDLVSAQGYASSPAQELGLDDKQFAEFSKLLDAGADLATNPGGKGDIMDAARQILGVGKTDKPQQKYVPGHVQKAQQKGRILTPEEENIFHDPQFDPGKTFNSMRYDELADLYGALSMADESDAKSSLVDKIVEMAKTVYPHKYKDSDFRDI